ncbi:unnamed protein product [Prorocentrum cordatum]|uniref:Feruloyl esterase n=1 Tax=Prorocentrum cordatum TaxID=2364126 RepID=A0ABN9RJI9_9DINO|nr:unnamed protein product [Polarella glacialis]
MMLAAARAVREAAFASRSSSVDRKSAAAVAAKRQPTNLAPGTRELLERMHEQVAAPQSHPDQAAEASLLNRQGLARIRRMLEGNLAPMGDILDPLKQTLNALAGQLANAETSLGQLGHLVLQIDIQVLGIYNLIRRGRFLAFEHPYFTASWMSETAGLVAQLPETRNLRIDARTFNLRVHGDGLSQKPTGIRTALILALGRAPRNFPGELRDLAARDIARWLSATKTSRRDWVDPRQDRWWPQFPPQVPELPRQPCPRPAIHRLQLLAPVLRDSVDVVLEGARASAGPRTRQRRDLRSKDGRRFEGFWSQGKQHGWGVTYALDGRCSNTFGENLKHAMLHLYNAVIQPVAMPPEKWKHTQVSVIHKTGLEATDLRKKAAGCAFPESRSLVQGAVLTSGRGTGGGGAANALTPAISVPFPWLLLQCPGSTVLPDLPQLPVLAPAAHPGRAPGRREMKRKAVTARCAAANDDDFEDVFDVPEATEKKAKTGSILLLPSRRPSTLVLAGGAGAEALGAALGVDSGGWEQDGGEMFSATLRRPGAPSLAESGPSRQRASIGARRRMIEMDGMEYQLFVPRGWSNNTLYPHPTVIYFHSHPERKWSLMNSESLPRMLARNQSQSFDNRSCWCLPEAGYDAYAETNDTSKAYDDGASPSSTGSPVADCTFADTFNSLVIMPQGWVGSETPGWTTSHFATIKNITTAIIQKFNGDADKVIVTGTAEGGVGALDFAKTYPDIVSAAIITDAPSATSDSSLDGLPIYVTADGSMGDVANVDALVVSLKGRSSGETKYTRYAAAPAAADPGFSANYGHSSDIIYRDPQLWAWAYSFKTQGGRARLGLDPLPFVKMH